MEFEKVQREHILQGIKDFEEKGYPNGFGPSSTYDLIYEGKPYPPKAIMAYANFHASGRKLERYFKGGEGTPCFLALEREGFNVIPKKEQMEKVNVKLEFAKWLLIHSPTSYNYYLGETVDSVIAKLNEINNFFPDQNFFEVDQSKITKKINEIRFLFSTKERKKHEEFLAYDKHHSNGIPKAVMGKNNYQRFLLEEIDNSNVPDFFTSEEFDLLHFTAGKEKEKGNQKFDDAYEELKKTYIKVEYWMNTIQKRLFPNGSTHIFKKPTNQANKFDGYLWGKIYPTKQAAKNKWLAITLGLVENRHFHVKIDTVGLSDNDPLRKSYFQFRGDFNNSEIVKIYPSVEVENWEELLKKSERDVSDLMNYYDKVNRLKESEINYWIFQGNPKIYDFETALRNDLLSEWAVSAHKNKINVGDKVILWITGNNSGCYALAEITSLPYHKSEPSEDNLWKVEDNNDVKAGIKITHNFVDEPVLKDQIESKKDLDLLKVGNQGTNFSATQKEYDAILALANQSTGPFEEYITKFDQEDLKAYFLFLFKILDALGLEKNDQRLHFSVRSGRLSFVIGQRYSWALFFKRTKEKFEVLSFNPIRDTSTRFNENFDNPYYTKVNDAHFSDQEYNSILKGFREELSRTTKSGFRDKTNLDFEKAVFDHTFRSRFTGTKTFKNMNKKSLNLILYGPPGTGKTYKLQNEYFEQYTISEEAVTKEQFTKEILADLSWWQVITLVMLDLQKATVSEIFNHELLQVKAGLSSSKTIRQTIWGQLQSHTVDDCEYVKVTKRSDPQYFSKDDSSTWTIMKELVDELSPELIEISQNISDFKTNQGNQIKNYEFVTFHQSFSYEDFVEGIKPIMDEGENDLGYTIQDGVFKKLCLRAKSDPNNSYAIFIDEINRGNVSAVFGELITLIEKDKRAGAKNGLEVQLPYSKEKFSVPSNLHIYGTMNTADRSVEALDTALRRRFTFKELMPDSSLLYDKQFDGFTLEEVLQTINERIKVLVDRDHTIGHSYFLSVSSGDTDALTLVFQDNIIPLLQEYFYHDYQKIALILGSGFIEEKTTNVKFAHFKNIEQPSIENQFILKTEIDDIENAMQLLLNKNED